MKHSVSREYSRKTVRRSAAMAAMAVVAAMPVVISAHGDDAAADARAGQPATPVAPAVQPTTTGAVTVYGDQIEVVFEFPATLIPTQWHGDPDKPRSLPEYARRLMTSAGEVVTHTPESLCHQESSGLSWITHDARTGAAVTRHHGFPPVPAATDRLRIQHDFHCDGAASAPPRWMDVNLFDLLPGLTSVTVGARVEGRSIGPTPLGSGARRLDFVVAP